MKSFKVVYMNPNNEPRATVVSYSEDGANDVADEMEDQGIAVLDIVQCALGTPCEEIEKMYKKE